MRITAAWAEESTAMTEIGFECMKFARTPDGPPALSAFVIKAHENFHGSFHRFHGSFRGGPGRFHGNFHGMEASKLPWKFPWK